VVQKEAVEPIEEQSSAMDSATSLWLNQAGKELLPDHVETYYRKCLSRWEGTVESAEGPSSASPNLSVDSIATDFATSQPLVESSGPASVDSGPKSFSPQPVELLDCMD
jgi:hypothetical protein